MTKKLLLSAAAVAAMAFAGAAGAADITGGKISNVDLLATAGKIDGAYLIATEAVLPSTGIATDPVAETLVTFGMDSPVAISANGKLPFAATFTLTGPATFTNTFVYTDLLSGTAEPSSGIAVLSADKKSVSFFVEFGDTQAMTINSLTLDNIALKVTGKEAVSISAEASVTVAGHTQKVTEVKPTNIIEFTPVLQASEVTAYSATAALNDFKTFKAAGTAGNVGSATATTVISKAIGISTLDNVYKDLAGGTKVSLTDVISNATVTINGPQVKALGAVIGALSPVTDSLTDTSVQYVVSASDLSSTGLDGTLKLTNPASPNTVVIEPGMYTAEIKPSFNSGFTGNADQTVSLINVGLEGTNFTAPWFALNNNGTTSSLRIANNGTAAVGPIIVSLKAHNGTKAPVDSFTIPSIAPQSFRTVSATELLGAFANGAKNGDLQVTIQSNVANVSAKVRTTQANGQVFEASLGAGSNVLITPPAQ